MHTIQTHCKELGKRGIVQSVKLASAFSILHSKDVQLYVQLYVQVFMWQTRSTNNPTTQFIIKLFKITFIHILILRI